MDYSKMLALALMLAAAICIIVGIGGLACSYYSAESADRSLQWLQVITSFTLLATAYQLWRTMRYIIKLEFMIEVERKRNEKFEIDH